MPAQRSITDRMLGALRLDVATYEEIVRLVVSLWILAATIVALRSALDSGTGRAIVVAVLASVVQIAVISLIAGLL